MGWGTEAGVRERTEIASRWLSLGNTSLMGTPWTKIVRSAILEDACPGWGTQRLVAFSVV